MLCYLLNHTTLCEHVCVFMSDASFIRSVSPKIRKTTERLQMTQWSECCSHNASETIRSYFTVNDRNSAVIV